MSRGENGVEVRRTGRCRAKDCIEEIRTKQRQAERVEDSRAVSGRAGGVWWKSAWKSRTVSEREDNVNRQ